MNNSSDSSESSNQISIAKIQLIMPYILAGLSVLMIIDYIMIKIESAAR
ncbi:UNVERIFIED_CONTAM: hypothetical protein O8I53_12130 [Campylobacter lari]